MATDAYSAASPTRRWPAPTPRQRRLTLIACITGSAVVFIDATVVNVGASEDVGRGEPEVPHVETPEPVPV